MKKILFTMALCLTSVFIYAENFTDTLKNYTSPNDDMMEILEPTYLKNVYQTDTWNSNWFVDIKGGTSAFIGSPVGCEDLFGRMEPVMQIGLGKWFTSAVAGRVTFQGFKLKNADIIRQSYKAVHADFLYNLTRNLNVNDQGISKWDIIPYLGLGIIHNEDTGKKPFSMHYGIIGQYRLYNRIKLSAEIGAMTTFRDFDGSGVNNKFGDNLLNFSVGLTYTFGKAGWQKVVDAKPYMEQNEWLIEYNNSLINDNIALERKNHQSDLAMNEYHKILEIEGLLDRYKDKLQYDDDKKPMYPKNDYSGLNSLRARMANKNIDDRPGVLPDSIKSLLADSLGSDLYNVMCDKYIDDLRAGRVGLGAPVYFFFKIGTTNLTDVSQLLNLDELARLINKYNLKVVVRGAADSVTGSSQLNDRLSKDRAVYLAHLLQDRGVNQFSITTRHDGGINEFSPVRANRHSCVSLTL